MSSNVTREARARALAKSGQLDLWAAYADTLYRLGYQLGRGAMAGMSYREAFALGHDTGLGARQDTREIVRGIIDGYSAGCQARHRLVAELLDTREPPCGNAAATRPPPGPSSATPAAATTHATSARPSSARPPTG